jgi:hypothetical protein
MTGAQGAPRISRASRSIGRGMTSVCRDSWKPFEEEPPANRQFLSLSFVPQEERYWGSTVWLGSPAVPLAVL